MQLHVIEIPAGAKPIGRLNPEQHIHFTIVLAQKDPLPPPHSMAEPPDKKRENAHSIPRPMTHAQLRELHGARSNSAKAVRAFAEQHGFKIVKDTSARRTVQLSGSASAVERAFKVRFEEFDYEGGRFFAPSGPGTIPDDLQGLVEIGLGLHSFPHSNPRRRSSVCCLEPSAKIADLARAYNFPDHLNAKGQTIGLIEFGGGYYPEDIEQFCRGLEIPVPTISVVNVGDAGNQPASHRAIHEFLEMIDGSLSIAAASKESESFVAAQSTAEVTMDLEILVALASGAHIVVYFAPSDEQGLYHALSHAVHDEHYKPDVLSISWSFPEQAVSKGTIESIETVLREAAHLGITVCASTGDSGALNGAKHGTPSVNYPASSPYCLACGGTSGRITPTGIEHEVVWNATHFGIHGASGGGISTHFHPPAWQRDATVPIGPGGAQGRGIPDVAGLADPRYGCEMRVIGRTFASAGTSAVAPVWAALIARINEALGRRCGHVHPVLYDIGRQEHSGLRAILKGQNGYYHAGERWNACTGYGTPRGDALLAYFESLGRDRS